MFNPGMLMKLMGMKNTFEKNHPKFVAFLQAMVSQGIQEDCVIEISVTRPDGRVITGNMKVTQEDLDLFAALRDLGNMQ